MTTRDLGILLRGKTYAMVHGNMNDQVSYLRLPRAIVGAVCVLAVATNGASAQVHPSSARIAESREFASWINERGSQVWGDAPENCSDLIYARRVYLDILGRVPSVSELRDFEAMQGDRRSQLVDLLVFGDADLIGSVASATEAVVEPAGPESSGDEPINSESSTVDTGRDSVDSAEPFQLDLRDSNDYPRLASQQMARHWAKVLSSDNNVGPAGGVLEAWLRDQFSRSVPYDQLMRPLVELDDEAGPPQYYRQVSVSPITYAGSVSRSLLGVRIECAQCHDHPFTSWKQEDFWGLAAFYTSAPAAGPDTTPEPSDQSVTPVSKITADGVEYSAKLLWSEDLIEESPEQARRKLGRWLCSEDNPYFTSTAANRFWQYLVGRGLYADIENLDQASEQDRELVDSLGKEFANRGFDIQVLIAAICKSNWYQAVSSDAAERSNEFYRPMKSLSPDQIFDSLEQSLLLPIGNADAEAPRWSGEMAQLLSRLNEASSESPEEYFSGIPQALVIMNGQITSNATSVEESRLLRAVIDSPFFSDADRLEVVYLAVLSRRPTENELKQLRELIQIEEEQGRGREVYGEILWALINSPEFVLCR